MKCIFHSFSFLENSLLSLNLQLATSSFVELYKNTKWYIFGLLVCDSKLNMEVFWIAGRTWALGKLFHNSLKYVFIPIDGILNENENNRCLLPLNTEYDMCFLFSAIKWLNSPAWFFLRSRIKAIILEKNVQYSNLANFKACWRRFSGRSWWSCDYIEALSNLPCLC